MENQFSHIDESGDPNMVNVSDKVVSKRVAKAQCKVIMPREVIAELTKSNVVTKKGAVFQTAIIAGIMAAKKTGELIPLCHPIGLDDCNIDISINEQNEIVVNSRASIAAKTGIEMEAMMAVSVAALTIYDMCKALSHNIIITDIKLMEKTGGKKDFKRE